MKKKNKLLKEELQVGDIYISSTAIKADKLTGILLGILRDKYIQAYLNQLRQKNLLKNYIG